MKFHNYVRCVFSLFLFCLILPTSWSQEKNQYKDQFLSKSFETFQNSDFQMAYHTLPFLKERFEEELRNESSFTNPFDSLSQRIGIMVSSDSLLKTYCWSERNGGCCHTSATYAQYKTHEGKIQFIDLEDTQVGDEEVFLIALHTIIINGSTHYLILAGGTCCGRKHYQTARIFKIVDNSFTLLQPAFGDTNQLRVGANRSQEIKLKYSEEKNTLSYLEYKYNPEVGFYAEKPKEKLWKLTKSGFKIER